MEEIRIGNFICVGGNVSLDNKNGWRVYYTREGEERFVGYSRASLYKGYDYDESILLGNKIGDYSDVMRNWKYSTTRRVYKVNIYEAYRIDEVGIRFMFIAPVDTIHYKHEIIGVKEVRFPAWKDGELVTENDHKFSFVSAEGIQTYLF